MHCQSPSTYAGLASVCLDDLGLGVSRKGTDRSNPVAYNGGLFEQILGRCSLATHRCRI